MGHMSPRLKARRGRFGPGGIAPLVTITSPANGFSAAADTGLGSPLTSTLDVDVTGTAIDDVDGDISASIVWTSSIDGTVGSGASDTLTLTAGTHTLTASAAASTGSPQAVGTNSITVTIT